jgi:chemotaxis methyl-accepting protein methylase
LDHAAVDILSFLSSHFGEDFQSYSKALAKKRIAERAAQLSLELAEYCRLLHDDAEEPAFLARMLRIRFSTFFRDPLQFELLGSVVLPSMLYHSPKGLFRVWSAACSGGEEAYSLAILLDEALQLLEVKPQVQIFATDVAEEALEEARLGRYLPDSLGGATLKRVDKYFTARKPGYQVIDSIREMVTYCRHDLLDLRTYVPAESLYGGFDLLLCRNFLMYLDQEAYHRVFDNLFRALNPEGVLLLGNAEGVPERYAPYLEKVVDFGNLYRKKKGS